MVIVKWCIGKYKPYFYFIVYKPNKTDSNYNNRLKAYLLYFRL